MKAFTVRYGVRGRYRTGPDPEGHLVFTDMVYAAEFPSLADVLRRARALHHPGYEITELTHVYEIKAW